MSGNKKVYEIGSEENLHWYNEFRKFYLDLKKELSLEKPIQQVDFPAITLRFPNYRGEAYKLELYELKSSMFGDFLLAIEIFGGIRTYARVENFPIDLNKAEKSSESDSFGGIRLTLHNSNEGLEKKIEEIIFRNKK